MTKEDALIIKEFALNGSWRTVATKAAERWPDRGYLHGHQIEGMELCREAAICLGECFWDQPWS